MIPNYVFLSRPQFGFTRSQRPYLGLQFNPSALLTEARPLELTVFGVFGGGGCGDGDPSRRQPDCRRTDDTASKNAKCPFLWSQLSPSPSLPLSTTPRRRRRRRRKRRQRIFFCLDPNPRPTAVMAACVAVKVSSYSLTHSIMENESFRWTGLGGAVSHRLRASCSAPPTRKGGVENAPVQNRTWETGRCNISLYTVCVWNEVHTTRE